MHSSIPHAPNPPPHKCVASGQVHPLACGENGNATLLECHLPSPCPHVRDCTKWQGTHHRCDPRCFGSHQPTARSIAFPLSNVLPWSPPFCLHHRDNSHYPLLWASCVICGSAQRRLQPKHIREFTERLSDFVQAKKILDGRVHDPYWTFSGGELQILNLAAAMSVAVDLVVMDEPTGRLDKSNRVAFWSCLADLLAKKKTTVLSTTHEESFRESSLVSLPHTVLHICNRRIEVAASDHKRPWRYGLCDCPRTPFAPLFPSGRFAGFFPAWVAFPLASLLSGSCPCASGATRTPFFFASLGFGAVGSVPTFGFDGREVCQSL